MGAIASAPWRAAEYHTDSNGLEMMPRVRNHRSTYTINLTEPITANYYPINTALSIKDAVNQLTITPDRACGGASLASGEAEFLVHRRLVGSDYPGFEPLNETQSARYTNDGFPYERIGQSTPQYTPHDNMARFRVFKMVPEHRDLRCVFLGAKHVSDPESNS